jgi:hypothetical protein
MLPRRLFATRSVTGGAIVVGVGGAVAEVEALALFPLLPQAASESARSASSAVPAKTE